MVVLFVSGVIIFVVLVSHYLPDTWLAVIYVLLCISPVFIAVALADRVVKTSVEA